MDFGQDGRAARAMGLGGSSDGGREPSDLPAAITDIGCERDINEDRYAIINSPMGRTWVVCDGMGGELGGDLAAQLAIDALRRSLESCDCEEPSDALAFAIEEANRIIVLRRQNPAFSGMGTTVVAALVCGDELVVMHVGDSRAYLIRGSEVEQLTTDHSYVQDLVAKGTITQEEALSHPQSHVLTRCLGAEPKVDVEGQSLWIWDCAASPADKLLLCSDGLYSLVSDSEIAEVVNSMSPRESCVELVEMAKERGGFDNITVAIMPVNGQVKTQRAAGSKRAAVRRRRRAPRERKPITLEKREVPLLKRLLLSFIFAVLGCVVGVVIVLLQLIMG